MNSVAHDILDDFEPRQLPKPAPRFDSPPVPSVPEVSLVFERPLDPKSCDYNMRRSPSLDKYDSYATWKQTTTLSHGTTSTQKPRHSIGSSIERCHSQSDANQVYKTVVMNESIRHSRSDPSLMKKCDALSIKQGSKKMPNRQTMSPSRDNIPKNISRGQVEFENNYTQSATDRQQYFLQEKNRDNYGDRERYLNPSSTVHNTDRYFTRHGNPNARPQQTNFDPNIQKLSQNQVTISPNRLPSDYPSPILQNSNYHANVFPRYHQFPSYGDTEYGYPYPHAFSPNIQTQRNENEETVKNLLQLINNQSEQIKSLQSQVGRLLKIQEENLKDREKCNCSRNLGLVNENYEANSQLSIQTTNNNLAHSAGNSSKLSRNDTIVAQQRNGTIERNMIESTNIKEMKKNLPCDYNNPSHETRLNSASRDEQLKNKILEQKVSIGVMTSFEFTVQNNPFAQETEEHRSYYGPNHTIDDRESENRDAAKTCQNVFSRVSNLPLENIIEDSESHLSVSQQPSSNCHSCPTIDESKSSEPAHRKNGKNVSITKSPESNPTYFSKNTEDMQDYGKENHSTNHRRQLLDAQEHFRNTQRSQSPKMTNNIPTTQIPLTENTLKHYHPTMNSPVPPDRCRRDPRDQNFIPQTENNNVFTPIPYKSTTNEPKQYNEQKGLHSPYLFENQKSSNKPPVGQDSSGNIGLMVQEHEPRSQQSPAANALERNRMLSRAKSSQDNCIEESIVLNSGELEINERPPPSPEPSIHVEMQEYSSDEDSDKHGGEVDKQTPKVGWTFYNNVLGQVNQILQNSPITRHLKDKPVDRENAMHDQKNKATVETVKIATMEQLRQLGISFVDNDPKNPGDMSNKKVTFDSSYYPRLEYRGNMTQATSTMSETDTSMHMNALALKYLSDEQLGELAMQKHSTETLKHLMVSNVQGTNMSFATMRYLERYQLLPTNNNNNNLQADNERKSIPRPKLDELRNAQRPSTSSQMTRMSCPSKILDISTLKQQPKLL